MGFKILAINPGSTSTKIALYDDEQPTLALTLRHSAEEIARFPRIIDQLDWRKEMVLEALAKNNFDVKSLSAVIGRGGLIKPIESGVYEVNAALKNDLVNAQREHASNLGGLIAELFFLGFRFGLGLRLLLGNGGQIAEQIAQAAGVKAYIADPVVVDELDDIARLSGIPECPRISIFHALNQKAIARRHAEKVGKRYEDLNLVVAHMGGGISVSAHCKGRVIDTNNALDGDGPIAPERAGTVPAGALVNLCFSGKYSQRDVLKMLAGKGGLVAHLNQNSGQQICIDIEKGDQKSKAVLDAMSYSIAKEIGAMAAVLKGQVDAILLTGGVAYNEPVNDVIREHCSFLAPIFIYPGEDEMGALMLNALSVLRGERTPKVYA